MGEWSGGSRWKEAVSDGSGRRLSVSGRVSGARTVRAVCFGFAGSAPDNNQHWRRARHHPSTSTTQYSHLFNFHLYKTEHSPVLFLTRSFSKIIFFCLSQTRNKYIPLSLILSQRTYDLKWWSHSFVLFDVSHRNLSEGFRTLPLEPFWRSPPSSSAQIYACNLLRTITSTETSPVDTIFFSVGRGNCRSAVSHVRTLSSHDDRYLFLNNGVSLKGLRWNILAHLDHELLDVVFEGGGHSSIVLRTSDFRG